MAELNARILQEVAACLHAPACSAVSHAAEQPVNAQNTRVTGSGRRMSTLLAGLVCALGVLACTGEEPGRGLSGAGGLAGQPPDGLGGTAGAVVPVDENPLPADDVPVDFFIDIQPILGDYCVRCHGGVRELPLAPKMPLNLQSRERAAHVLGQAGTAESSLLYLKVISEDAGLRMPFGAPALSAENINKLRRWIIQGAPWPEQWAFAPVTAPDPAQVPVSDEAWVHTPVDRFVLNRLDKAGIKPSPEADPTTLIRRVSLDLTGLPPTPAAVDAFVNDASPNAYETVVDGLLASPAFGERWGRHWLDLARYSDSDGYEKDLFRKNAWRWRDWVIDSFNSDQPFDDFTIDQIAGDLRPAATPLQVAGTGFHRQTLINREGGIDPEEDRTKRVIDRVATVAQTWLGLTMGCTQCHSHPYDNLKHEEFYQLAAFFNNADDSSNYEDIYNPDTTLTVMVPASGNGQGAPVATDVVTERAAQRRPTYLLLRGDFLRPDMSKDLLGGTPALLPPLMPRAAQPDRLDLANWLVRADNPLTPRVAVNTIWYQLFGRGLVGSLDDFGARAQYPSHPELLDWLASDFRTNGWKRKRFIKQILMSATYRQSSVFRADVAMLDTENAWLSRQNRLRVSAEVVADINLAAAGLLSPKMGGPSAFPPLPDELRRLVNGSYGSFNWPETTGEDRYRRGVYTLHKRLALYPNLAVFDWPASAASTTGRLRTNTPLQSLATLHSTLFVEAGQALARRVQAENPGSLSEQLVWAMRLVVGRAPTDAELTVLQTLFADQKALYAADAAGAASVVGGFAPVGVPAADAAAWVMTASAILNLDEAINRE